MPAGVALRPALAAQREGGVVAAPRRADRGSYFLTSLALMSTVIMKPLVPLYSKALSPWR